MDSVDLHTVRTRPNSGPYLKVRKGAVFRVLGWSLHVECPTRTNWGRKARARPFLMKIHYSSTGELSEEAQKLVDFDIESIQLVVAAQRSSEPDVWIVAPEGYQAKGHLLRDSDSIRLMAYSNRSDIIYATDGCNSCRHILEAALEATDENGLATLAERTQLANVNAAASRRTHHQRQFFRASPSQSSPHSVLVSDRPYEWISCFPALNRAPP